ncbi:MAG: hypothetical protein PUH68_02760, partial [Bacteroidales bacterium]|nr:hypothetical protein [Bacteroidales bacterium]
MSKLSLVFWLTGNVDFCLRFLTKPKNEQALFGLLAYRKRWLLPSFPLAKSLMHVVVVLGVSG